MVYSNLAGTTSDLFSITKIKSRDSVYGENGVLLSGNTYDLWWNMSGILGEEYMNKSVHFIAYDGTTDLNNCDSPGQYICSWTYLDKLANIPDELRGTTNNFIMISHPCDYGLYDGRPCGTYSLAVQELTTSTGRRYFRTKYNQSWSAWQRVAFTSEIPVMPTLHAVATSGDYNHLINKPNISAGPTVETGTFRLSAPNVTVLAYPYFNYIKYGKIVMADLSCRIAPIVMGKGAITLTGMPFLPEQDVKGVFISCACTVDVKGEVAVTSGQLIYLDNGNMSIYLNLVEGRSLLLSCENIKGAIDISGTIVYVAK